MMLSSRIGTSALSGLMTIVAGMLTLCLPVLLFFSRAGADVAVSVVAVLFVLRSVLLGSWDWTRAGWFRLALLFWAVMVLSSDLAGPRASLIQAVLSLRFFLFCAATATWAFRASGPRRVFGAVCSVLALWVVLQSWIQFLTGHNLSGFPRWNDGALTGPFYKPRAGNAFLMVFFPGVMPPVLALLRQRRVALQAAGVLVLFVCVATMILIGQRMPTLLLLTGLGLTALLVRRLRWPVLGALGVAAAVLAALPVLSPPTYAKLVLKFTQQISHFTQSAYGQLYIRAAVMISDHPLIGLGFDGFRNFCNAPAYARGLPSLGLPFIPDGENCNIHPHNYYFQAGVSAGLTGLALFVGMILAWGRTMVRALEPSERPMQAMLMVACVVVLWPLASTSALFSLPPAGWIFLLAGAALAASGERQ
ncbi:O-antigen ligase family protein [Acetobacter sp. AN02]|uniref:O-antigen ligase family protein n=1 Tax=Acetobacter sp. AN02 TaxID=2894186 RepID=UPI0024344E9B|nr:O-antigen ligase family protein [Acetobacter sp. AN02]MDG6094492.1 O-antigen ligase family protein [Acetobacter sp. AN02]